MSDELFLHEKSGRIFHYLTALLEYVNSMNMIEVGDVIKVFKNKAHFYEYKATLELKERR